MMESVVFEWVASIWGTVVFLISNVIFFKLIVEMIECPADWLLWTLMMFTLAPPLVYLWYSVLFYWGQVLW